jgi:HipA-like C-terminal domain
MITVEQLLSVLRRQGVVRATELAAQLTVSRPTLSRLLANAADAVCRIGRGRATQYALTREIPNLGSRLPVYRVDDLGSVQQYGTIHLLANGGHWLERTSGPNLLFPGGVTFVSDMCPQGYMGRSFSSSCPELNLPPLTRDWNEDHRLTALARRGEDCSGNLIIGEESLNRFLAAPPSPISRSDYPGLVTTSLLGLPGSSAAGEQPKFTAYSEGSHVITKFADGDPGAAAQRWRDLLVCEKIALDAIRATGIETADATWFDIDGYRFLEVKRFDRIGARGRRGMLSLAAVNSEYLGLYQGWTKAARGLYESSQIAITAEDVRRIGWLDAFGRLIANDDRHFGNLSFFVGEDLLSLQLAPVYDMLPMFFAPKGTTVIVRAFVPPPPDADNFDIWRNAAECALRYWARLADTVELSSGFREICSQCRDTMDATLRSV